MKVYAYWVFALACSSYDALACPNLSGAFEVASQRDRKNLMTIQQQGCGELVLGVVNVKSGKVVGKVEGAETFSNRSLPHACVGSSCRFFEEDKAAFKLARSGLIDIGADHSEYPCFYNEVTLSLTPKGNLKKTYSLVSVLADHPCAQFKTFAEELKRVRVPQFSAALNQVRR